MTARPFTKYRPSQSRDGDYGYSKSLGAGETIYGEVTWHENELEFIYSVGQDIQIGDIIESGDGVQYRVNGKMMPSGGMKYKAKIERTEKYGKS